MIALNNVTYTYAKGTPFEKTALFNVSMNVNDGDFVAIVGSTGSGKSTLIQVIAKLLPTDGVNTTGTVGLVFQHPEDQLFEETVESEIAFAPKNFGCNPQQIEQRIITAMKQVGLPPHYRSLHPLKLSGGEQRRVALASILAMNPDTLILDEPTAGLDAQSKKQLLTEIKRLNDAGTTLIIVTHDMDAAAKFADRLIVMFRGKILADGAPRDVFQRNDVIKTAGLAQPATMMILNRLKQRGVNIKTDAVNLDECEATIKQCFKI